MEGRVVGVPPVQQFQSKQKFLLKNLFMDWSNLRNHILNEFLLYIQKKFLRKVKGFLQGCANSRNPVGQAVLICT